MISEYPIASAALATTQATTSSPATAVFPSPADVISGTLYGPNGQDFIGTLEVTSSNAEEIAQVVWAHKLALSIVNFQTLK